MGSWIRCLCGESVHMNLFCGAKVSLGVSEEMLEGLELEPEMVPSKGIREVVMKSDHLVRCLKCGRFAIEERGSGKLTFLAVEPPSSSPETKLNLEPP